MDFKKILPKPILVILLLAGLAMGVILWKFNNKSDPSMPESVEALPQAPTVVAREVESDTSKQEDAAIQQLDHDREEQKQTKDLKMKLEQTNIELEQEKAMTEINKLKMENGGAFKEPSGNGLKDFPEVKVEYIGGDNVKKEAILSIAGASYQVKENTSPIDNIQVMSISDTSVTLHFKAPQELTKTIEFKPE